MKITNQKFQTFYPNQYSPEEQAALDDLRKTVAERGGVGPMADRTVTADQSKMLDYARLWNPYDPLYNDPSLRRRDPVGPSACHALLYL